MCQVRPVGIRPMEGDAEGLADGDVEGDWEGLVEGEGPGLGGVEPPLGTCSTVVPPLLLGGTETVTGLVEAPPSVKPPTGAGLGGSRRAQFCPEPSKLTSQRGM